jgi:hypothetical protein
MNSFSKQILQSNQFFPKILIGALLIYSVIGIPLFIGYVARYLHQLSEQREITLPQWNNWLALLIESWELLLILIAYAFLPCTVIYWVSASIDQWFGFLWMLVWLPFMLSILIAPVFVCLAFHQYLQRGTVESIFDIRQLYRRFLVTADDTLPLTVTLWGALLLGFPVFGFTIAISVIMYMSVTINAIDTTQYR